MTQLSSNLAPQSRRLSRTLWKCGLGTLLFLLALAVACAILYPNQALRLGQYGGDLIPSYMAGSFVREGRSDKLMDYSAAVRFQAALRGTDSLPKDVRVGPWLNPPWFAWLFVPLSCLPLHEAKVAWLVLNLLLLAGSILLLREMLRGGAGSFSGRTCATLIAPSPRPTTDRQSSHDWRIWGLIPLLMMTSMPFLQVLASQQNTFLSLLLLSLTATLWRRGNGLPAGLVAGLLLFKPQMAALVGIALVCSLRRRALLGLAITAATLLITTVVFMPGALSDWLTRMPGMVPWLHRTDAYRWERQVTLAGFWRLLLTGQQPGTMPTLVTCLWPLCAIGVAAPLGIALFRTLRCRPGTVDRDRLIAATVAATPMLMPYFMEYDLLLLAVPAVLLAVERMNRPADRLARWLTRGFFILFPLLFFNDDLAVATRVNPAVLLLAAMAFGFGWRACRSPAQSQPLPSAGDAGHCLAPTRAAA